MLFFSMLAGIVAVNGAGYKLKLSKGDGNDCNAQGTVTDAEGDTVKGITNDSQTSDCLAFPSAWDGVVGQSGAYKSYKISCTWDDADEKNPVLFSSEMFSDTDCKTKSSDALFAADYESGTCFVSGITSKPVTFTMGDQLLKACKKQLTDAPTPEPTEEGKSAAAELFGLAGFVAAMAAAAM